MNTTTNYITRKQYDALIEHFPDWMEDHWSRFRTRWYLSGVYVNGSVESIESLDCQLYFLERLFS